jgi:hypothetical protein
MSFSGKRLRCRETTPSFVAMVRDGAFAPPHHEDPTADTFLILRSALLRASRRMRHTRLLVLATSFCPRLAITFAPQKKRAQGRPGARCTRGLVCNCASQEMRTRACRFSGNTPAFPAQWLYGLFRALPGDRLSCHHRPREAFASQELDASVEASGPHDFAVRFSTTRQPCRPRPPHPAPRFVTIASRPFWWDGIRTISR